MASQQQFYYKNNRLQQLRGFCYAAQFGSITRAAKHMHLAHSSVSLQVKALEDDLGVKLFVRRGPQITLTHEGERLLERTLPLLDGIQNLQEDFQQDLKSAKRTELHIAVNSTTKSYLTPSIVGEYVKTYHDIYVTLHFAKHE